MLNEDILLKAVRNVVSRASTYKDRLGRTHIQAWPAFFAARDDNTTELSNRCLKNNVGRQDSVTLCGKEMELLHEN